VKTDIEPVLEPNTGFACSALDTGSRGLVKFQEPRGRLGDPRVIGRITVATAERRVGFETKHPIPGRGLDEAGVALTGDAAVRVVRWKGFRIDEAAATARWASVAVNIEEELAERAPGGARLRL
jgi:hypothetical protein